MSKVLQSARSADLPYERVYAGDLDAALDDTLAALADIDRAYEARLNAINKSAGSQGQKTRLRADVESLHQQDRQPLVLRLADLHYRKMRLTFFRTLH